MVAKRPKFCGWGYEGDGLTQEEREMVLARYAERFGLEGFENFINSPSPDQVDLHASRIEIPAA